MTLPSPVTNISEKGFWLIVENKKYFVPFGDYPVFKHATTEQIFAARRIAPGHYHWHLLDADVELAALESPEQFPLVYH